MIPLRLFKKLETEFYNQIGSRILQIGVGGVILYRCISELPVAQFIYGPEGAAIGSAVSFFGSLGIWIDKLFYSYWGIYVTFFVWGLGGAGLIFGVYPRLSTLLALFGTLLLELRGITHDGGDNILRLILLYMILFHPLITKKERSSSDIKSSMGIFLHNLGVIAVYLQLVILYFISSTTKLHGEMWINGTAVYYVSQLNEFGMPTSFLRDLFKNPFVTTTATYLTMIYQLFFPAILLTSSKVKLPYTLFGILLHLNFAINMGLVTFSLIMISLLLFTVKDNEWKKIAHFVKGIFPDFTVYYDGYCNYCSRTARIIHFLDCFGLFRVVSYRQDSSYLHYGLTFEDVDEEMHIIKKQNDRIKIYRGFDSVAEIVNNLPLLWMFVPFIYLLRISGLGYKLYPWIANNRMVPLNGQICKNEACSITDSEESDSKSFKLFTKR
ncbi:putative Membrane protein / vitamin k-dependent gamma-carboxylase [[Clostridium] ultunense Esp]|nr:putative Membrane protein / vitamin k-dependent gamma-carboxylase [[Clostridium] ultunense Esp]